jgi:glycolate oxidase subunit GlcD
MEYSTLSILCVNGVDYSEALIILLWCSCRNMIDSAEKLDRLSSVLKGKVVSDSDVLQAFSKDMSPVRGDALAVVRPSGPEDVLTTVQWAVENLVPLVGRGGGSSLEGESVPVEGAVVIDFSGMNRILEVDEENLSAMVEPGVVNRVLNRFLYDRGLFFPPNPGSWEMSTIGGNAATNAAGPRSYKYGSVRNWVNGIEVVLGTAEKTWFGTRSRKSSSGLDMVRLLVGSEGTLGLFTKLLVRLAPVPAKRVGIIVPLDDVDTATKAVVRLAHTPSLNISALEFVDNECLEALNRVQGSSLPESAAALMVEVETEPEEADRRLYSFLSALSDFKLAGEPLYEDNVDAMWDLRGRITLSLEKLYGQRYREDVAVPITAFPDLVRGVKRIFASKGVDVVVFGHAGDGNLHLEFSYDRLEKEKLDKILTELFALAVRLNGTISGEHGIGSLKLPYLSLEHSEVSIQAMRRIKKALDPCNILNPGKAY